MWTGIFSALKVNNKNKLELMFTNNSMYYSDFEKIKSSRILCALSAIFFSLFFLVDLWAIPSSIYEIGFIRLVVVASFLIAYGLTHTTFFAKYHDTIVLSAFLIAASSIEYMIFIAKPGEYAFDNYFIGLLLVLIPLFSWTYVNIKKAILLAVVALFVYVSIEVYGRNHGVVVSYSIIVTNVLFLVTALSVGFTARVMRDKFLHENYLLQRSLKEMVKQKTVEAKDNAYLANHDALTNLPNRRYATQLLDESLKTAKKEDKILAILFLDLNGFKQVNDAYGHAVGDEVLSVVAKRLEFAIREGDYLSRLAGDEFIVGLLMEKERISEVEKMSDKFTDVLSKPMNIDGVTLNVGVSIGIAAYPMHGDKINVLLDIADKKMYKIKKDEKDAMHDRQQAEMESDSVVIFPGNTGN